ncbi:MAG: metalloregulator ArsR/SmtB family transcription factor [Burkholderiaceae bacterium]
MQQVFESVARQFGVLGEPARLRILHVLCEQEHCVNDILHLTGLAQANASRHLGLMYRAGVVSRRREGTQVFYKVSDPLYIDLCRAFAGQVPDSELAMQTAREGMRHLAETIFPHPAQAAGVKPTPPANEKEDASV